ncbi:hypothetical protein HY604_02530 [Candidatus Peregrinibacteria bacterium]|nr:hypothetical protein [Candidatus Peregrinibacteria bacterium]
MDHEKPFGADCEGVVWTETRIADMKYFKRRDGLWVLARKRGVFGDVDCMTYRFGGIFFLVVGEEDVGRLLDVNGVELIVVKDIRDRVLVTSAIDEVSPHKKR